METFYYRATIILKKKEFVIRFAQTTNSRRKVRINCKYKILYRDTRHFERIKNLSKTFIFKLYGEGDDINSVFVFCNLIKGYLPAFCIVKFPPMIDKIVNQRYYVSQEQLEILRSKGNDL